MKRTLSVLFGLLLLAIPVEAGATSLLTSSPFSVLKNNCLLDK